MRLAALVLVVALAAAPGARAEIRSADECAAAVAADPAAAREDAAIWLRLGGGVRPGSARPRRSPPWAPTPPPPRCSAPSAPIPIGRCPPTRAR